MINKILLGLFLMICMFANAQKKSVNNYKYIIVPEKFDFLKKADQYQTSSLTKFLLQKKGFTVFLSNEELPSELAVNKCLALYAKVVDKSGMLAVRSAVELRDCFNNVVYTSQVGKTKSKEYKKAYHQAIRNAVSSMQDVVYEYKEEPIQKEEVIIAKNISDKVVKNVVISPKVIETPLVKDKIAKKESILSKELKVLYAQEKNNGFQLVNTKPEVVFMILKTNVKDVFILKDKNGILYKNGTHWIAEYYKNNQLHTEKYQIKF
ncbi:hypothetical protein MC378_11465 [Polaribacter sp. MSW13]|uniref:Uncharacterized protein n=1 Tax=Polaribacter marinus TaxID=2916838 RepID=A0A9X1VUH7_9FLAO|nr:hypothetical protein [Polaribacter marinus]MCI2229786.1 hypothetical protein [Polaribacter marinus]